MRTPLKAKIMIGAVAGAAALAVASPAGAQDLSAADVQANLDNVFIIVCATLVIFMQAGFALVEAGLTRAKSVGNIMMKNLMDFCAGAVAFFAVGYALAYGQGNDFFGTEGWFLGDGAPGYGNLTMPTFFLFQVAFAATAATIVSGAMAERTKFKSYFVYSIVISGLIYPIVVHWQWGGGWLAKMGTPFHDFAGSTLVHMTGGVASLMGAMILGPRIGKYGKDGKPRAIPGHSIPFVVLGAMILLVGWFGFNPGSELAADGAIGPIALNTVLAGAAGAVGTMMINWFHSGKPDVAMACNGLLAGLVGITAGAAAMTAVTSVLIGFLAGLLVYGSVLFFDRIGIDDPVGAISVHGACGIFGTLAVGLFARQESDYWKQGLFFGGGADQLISQVIGVVAVGAFVAVTTGILFLTIKATIGLRVEEHEEIEGLDVLEHGSPGYAGDISHGAGGLAGSHATLAD
ncbi:MAG TPA: ammonium transporter [Acidimicrobiales bacterium]|jgi:Amt family ammonium transporter|nr:ammonium transporter [Acidimicrobiales bacterium]